MSIIRHHEAFKNLHGEDIDAAIRDSYLKRAAERRRTNGDAQTESEGTEEGTAPQTPDQNLDYPVLTEEQFAEMAAQEEFLLSISEKGYGVRTSTYDYRVSGRGGQGNNNMDMALRDDAVIAVFPIGHNDQIMLVTDGGMVIRVPVHDIRIARRGSAGVVVFKVGDGERVVSVAHLPEGSDDNGNGENGDEGDDDAPLEPAK